MKSTIKSSANGEPMAPNPGTATDEPVTPMAAKRRAQAKLEANNVTVEQGLVGIIDAERVELHQAGAGAIFASKDVIIDKGGGRDIVAAGSITATQAGFGMVVAGGDARLANGGGGLVASLGKMEIENGGAALLVAGSAVVGQGGAIGLAITPRLEVTEGGRVFGGPALAIGAIGGVVFGLVLGWLIGASRR